MAAQPAPVPDPAKSRKSFRLVANIAIEVDVPTIAVPVPAMLADLSEGGCQIASRVKIATGHSLEFSLRLENKSPLRLRGIVRSVKERPETRAYYYGVQFDRLRPAEQDAIYQFVVDKQRKELQQRPVAPSPGGPQTKGRAAYRAQRNFPVRYAVVGTPGSNPATALDLSRGGSRVAFDGELREDRELVLRFTLPSDVLAVLTRHEATGSQSVFGHAGGATKEVKARPFEEMQIHAKVLPGAERIKGKFIYRLVFQRSTPYFEEEIERFVHAAQLTELHKTRLV
jgi:hypothetical protein